MIESTAKRFGTTGRQQCFFISQETLFPVKIKALREVLPEAGKIVLEIVTI